MTDESQLRLFMGGWIGGMLVSNTHWWGGLGILAAVFIAWASVKITWWWADRGRTE